MATLGAGVMEREEKSFVGGDVCSNLVLVLQVGSVFKNSPGFILKLFCTF